jgi:hypothetical protein
MFNNTQNIYIVITLILIQVNIKQETIKDAVRQKTSVLRVDEIDLVNECGQLYDAIMKY